jgi:hypothetical protein
MTSSGRKNKTLKNMPDFSNPWFKNDSAKAKALQQKIAKTATMKGKPTPDLDTAGQQHQAPKTNNFMRSPR